MTDLPDEAVEAAARAYLRGDRMGVGENSGRHRSGILSALTAAAPLIAARERTTAGAMTELFKAEHEKSRDLRAGIEALRDEWRMHQAENLRSARTQPENSSGLLLHTAIAGLCKTIADALDALLREGE